jgi:hypothetical protein
LGFTTPTVLDRRLEPSAIQSEAPDDPSAMLVAAPDDNVVVEPLTTIKVHLALAKLTERLVLAGMRVAKPRSSLL